MFFWYEAGKKKLFDRLHQSIRNTVRKTLERILQTSKKFFFLLRDFFFVRSNNFIWPLTFKHSSRNNPCLYHAQTYLN